jgi:hypothetical protein
MLTGWRAALRKARLSTVLDIMDVVYSFRRNGVLKIGRSRLPSHRKLPASPITLTCRNACSGHVSERDRSKTDLQTSPHPQRPNKGITMRTQNEVKIVLAHGQLHNSLAKTFVISFTSLRLSPAVRNRLRTCHNVRCYPRR